MKELHGRPADAALRASAGRDAGGSRGGPTGRCRRQSCFTILRMGDAADIELSCGHCGFSGPVEKRGDVLLARWVDGDFDRGDPIIEENVIVYRCPVCKETTVWQYSFSDAYGGAWDE